MSTVEENDSPKYKKIIVNISTIVGSLLGVLYILILLAAYNVFNLPYITDNFSAFIGLVIFGFAMCMFVFPIRATFQENFKWASVRIIFAIVIGILAVAYVILVILVKFEVMENIRGFTMYPNAFIFFSLFVFIKWISATIHLFVKYKEK